ncbi:MAG: hypothetical protein QME07_04245 [bacterium]|nr:hypothetical protein [bacterium]
MNEILQSGSSGVIEKLQFVSVFVSIIAVITVIILWILKIRAEKTFQFVRAEDTKKIEALAKEREELREEMIKKLDLLAEKDKDQENILLHIFKQREERSKQEQEDLTNWLEYKAAKWQHEIEDKFSARFDRLFLDIEAIKTRLDRLEGNKT